MLTYKRTIKDFVEPELRSWPGVSFTVEKPGKGHPRIVMHYRGRSRFVVVSSTSGDNRGGLNLITNVRRELNELGAKKL